MSIHHFAIATKDYSRAHQFYTEAMGFPLVAGVRRRVADNGWTKHMFYDCGHGSSLAIWDLRLDNVKDDDWRTGLSTGLGLPWTIVHLAFGVDSLEELDAKKDRLLAHGVTVSRVEHEFITSIYMNDPDDNMVEFTTATRPLDDNDRIAAEAMLTDDSVPELGDYATTVFFPDGRTKLIPGD